MPDHHVLIEDRYITGTRLRLRRMTDRVTGAVAFKLAKKYEAADPLARPMVNAYLTAAEYEVFATLPAHAVVKCRHRVDVAGRSFGVDVFGAALDGLLLAEIEAESEAALAAIDPPNWVAAEVSDDARFQGGHLASLTAADFAASIA